LPDFINELANLSIDPSDINSEKSCDNSSFSKFIFNLCRDKKKRKKKEEEEEKERT
jgi:hypothetical protein